MLKYTLKRILIAILTLLILISAVFVMIRLLPGESVLVLGAGPIGNPGKDERVLWTG